MTNRFEEMYKIGKPMWDNGAPQKVFTELYEVGEISGEVLDIGCGTGEESIYLASQGLKVVGFDYAPTAIKQAKAKAEKAGVEVDFRVVDALQLDKVDQIFDTIIDSALYHTFSDLERDQYLDSMTHITKVGTKYFLLCFSDKEPGEDGPRRVTQAEIRDSFKAGWHIEYIKPSLYQSTKDNWAAKCWLAKIVKQ